MRTIEVKIAVRNLWSNSRRTLLTLFISVIGLACVLFISGYISMVRVGLREMLISEKSAHFQIYKKGYLEQDDLTSMKYSLAPEEVSTIESILMPREEVEAIFPRINVQGIIGNYEKSKLFLGYGTDPFYESYMSYGKVLEGEKLSIEDSQKALIGKGLADKLGTALGDIMQIQVPNEGGGVEAELVTIGGIADFGPKELNDSALIISIETARSLNYTENAQMLLVILKDTSHLEWIYDYFHEEAQKAGLQIETKTWLEMDPFYVQVLRDYTFQLNLISSIFLFVILLAISNTIYMSIAERTPEIGTLRAIGISRVEIIRTVLFEGLVLGVTGAIIGVLIAYGLQNFFNIVYIELPPPPTLTDPIRLSIMLESKYLIYYSALLILSSALATVFPAIKASNTNIVTAIRHA